MITRIFIFVLFFYICGGLFGPTIFGTEVNTSYCIIELMCMPLYFVMLSFFFWMSPKIRKDRRIKNYEDKEKLELLINHSNMIATMNLVILWITSMLTFIPNNSYFSFNWAFSWLFIYLSIRITLQVYHLMKFRFDITENIEDGRDMIEKFRKNNKDN
ncbi:MAG: hypothetical protein J1F35_06510 [Erysipelotrichales bacterium]|nr:hypothetical protein [Erysipelotrichales bacterium]